jgi:phasin family protein
MEKPAFPMIDFQKMMEQFKLPGIDVAALMEARRKDMEALNEVNKITLASLQALGQKQSEILQTTFEELSKTMSGGKPMESAAHQGELAKHALDKAFAYMRELADVTRKTQTDAAAVINERVQQNMQDMKKLLQSKK